jgi:hypothetical protein
MHSLGSSSSNPQPLDTVDFIRTAAIERVAESHRISGLVLNPDPLDFIEGDFIGAAVVELGGAGTGVISH